MPELPEVEVLARHLDPILRHKIVRGVLVRRPKVIRPTSERELKEALCGARFLGVTRRGKYLLFRLRSGKARTQVLLVGHLGMTGRFHVMRSGAELPKHAAVVLDLGRVQLVYEDTRYFGRMTLDASGPAKLGPEPLGPEFTNEYFARELKRSGQSVKVKLLDQTLVAGVGNIYASEALWRAGISPRLAARKLSAEQVKRLRRSIREVLARAIRFGSTVPLDFAGKDGRNGLFYYGQSADAPDFYEERLQVYDRAGKPCRKCGEVIQRFVQAARSTYHCARCQG